MDAILFNKEEGETKGTGGDKGLAKGDFRVPHSDQRQV